MITTPNPARSPSEILSKYPDLFPNEQVLVDGPRQPEDNLPDQSVFLLNSGFPRQ